MKKLIVFILAISSLTFANAAFGPANMMVKANYTLKDGTYLQGYVVFEHFEMNEPFVQQNIDGKVFNKPLWDALLSKFLMANIASDKTNGRCPMTIYEKINLLPSVHLPGDNSAYATIPIVNVDEIHEFDLYEVDELELTEIKEVKFELRIPEVYQTTKEILTYLGDNKMINHEVHYVGELDQFVYLLNFNPYNNNEEIKRLFNMYKKALLSEDKERIEYATERLERRGIIPIKEYSTGCC